MKSSETNRLLEFYIKDDYLLITNAQHSKDNVNIKIDDIEGIKFIRELTIWNKIIEQTFGFAVPAKSELIRIWFNQGFKDVIVTNCDSKKAEVFVYEVNHLLQKQNY